jgi:hypothetical protein
MSFGVFGPGILIISRTDTAVPLAINVGFANELTLDAAGTTKQLYGQNQFALLAARGTIKATGKWKAAQISGIAWNAAFYGNTGGTTAGFSTSLGFSWNIDSTFTASTVSSAITVASTSAFDADLGVRYVGTNLPLQRVTTGLEGSSGKYSITAATPGVYNFGSVDAGTGGSVPAGGTALKVTYTSSGFGSNVGQSLILANQLIGSTPTFQLDYYTNLNQPGSKPFAIRLFQCIGAKHAMAFKLEDFMMPEFDFDFFANAAGNVFQMVYPEIS